MSKGCGARAAADMAGRMSSEDKALGLRASKACTSSQAAGLRKKHNHIVRYSSGPSYLHGGDSNLVAGLDWMWITDCWLGYVGRPARVDDSAG